MSMFNFAPLQNFNSKKLESEEGWVLTNYGKVIHNLLGKLSRTQRNIGTQSVYGKVERLSYEGNEHLFVLKKIDFKNNNSNRAHIFDTEITVGSKKNIGRVGPRVLAFRRTPFGGEYIMDNVEMGNATAIVKPLSKVRILLTPELSGFWDAIEGAMLDFHRITHGQHGDLHGDNILIVQIGKQRYIRIIDYGAFRNENEIKSKKLTNRKHYGLNVYNLGKGQQFIHNKNFFSKLKSK